MQNRMIFSLMLLLALPVHAGAQQRMPLSLAQAVDAAIEPGGNTRVQLAREAVRLAEAQASEVRAQLLPDIHGTIGSQRQTRSLSTMGLHTDGLPEGFQIPGFVGPFNTFDARATASQKLLDLSAIRRYQASKASAGAATEDNATARNEAAAEAARLYVAGVRAQSLLGAAESNLKLSGELLRLAQSQKQAGTGTGIDVTRAEVQLAHDRQALLAAQTEVSRARLELLKSVGLDLKTPVELTDTLAFSEAITRSFEQAMSLAYETLPSLKAQKQRERSAELARSAVRMERLPSATAFADYGSTGLNLGDSRPTRTIGFSVRLPIFDGGAREARTAEKNAVLSQERIRTKDLERGIELEIRIALDALASADAQVQAADEGAALSSNELEQARRRYTAGVATSVEVTDAQNRVQRAKDNQISALFNHAVARIDLAAATGTIQQLVWNWR